VPKIDVGEKQTCPQCGAKFYDLTRRPAVCPKCSLSFDPCDEVVRAKRAKATRANAYNPATEDDDEAVDAEEVTKADDDDEAEADPELVEVTDEAPEGTLIDEDDEDVAVEEEDELGEGFSEADVEVEDAEDDDSVPFLEDDDEFEEEIGDIGSKDEDL
jgi:uncharacterized protein (TIGR02300 family)